MTDAQDAQDASTSAARPACRRPLFFPSARRSVDQQTLRGADQGPHMMEVLGRNVLTTSPEVWLKQVGLPSTAKVRPSSPPSVRPLDPEDLIPLAP
jgi:hypothetical protein